MSIVSLSEVTLVVFACEGREHLLENTLASFDEYVPYGFLKRILVIDGTYDLSCSNKKKFDFLIQNVKRKGYVYNILNAINCIHTEFFFWLEDDWIFSEKVELEKNISILHSHPTWAQIRLSKTAPLTLDEKSIKLSEKVFKSIYGFSANPCLCRTAFIKQGFNALHHTSRDLSLGFEEFLSQWYQEQDIVCAVIDPGESAIIAHAGYLESTPRQWHMTASLDGTTSYNYLSGMRGSAAPPLWRKWMMLIRLLRVFFTVSIKQFWSRAAYDLAFRFIAVSKELKD
jgi:hypothetical protein